MASLKFVLDFASTVRLRVGPGFVAFGAGDGIALLLALHFYVFRLMGKDRLKLRLLRFVKKRHRFSNSYVLFQHSCSCT